MKFFTCLYCIFLMVPAACFADAGFNIGRPKAPCFAVFTGIDQLPGYEFFKITEGDQHSRGNIEDSSFRLRNNDTIKISYSDERRRNRGPVQILVRDKTTREFVDSFNVTAEGDNLAIHFSSSGNKAPMHTIDKTKAAYPYRLYGDEKVDQAAAKRNKYILISMSAIGFFLLFFIFFKKKNESVKKTE